jgi:hypothetical protein
VTTETVESTALRAVSKHRLMKSQQTEKTSARCNQSIIFELAIALQLFVASSCMSTLNELINPTPGSSHLTTSQ